MLVAVEPVIPGRIFPRSIAITQRGVARPSPILDALWMLRHGQYEHNIVRAFRLPRSSGRIIQVNLFGSWSMRTGADESFVKAEWLHACIIVVDGMAGQ